MKTPVVLSLNRIIVAKCSPIPIKIGNRIDRTKEKYICWYSFVSKHSDFLYILKVLESILGALRLSSKYIIMHRITSVKIINVLIFPITYCMKSSNSKCSIRTWIHVAGCMKSFGWYSANGFKIMSYSNINFSFFF